MRNYLPAGADEYTLDFHFQHSFTTAYHALISGAPSDICSVCLTDAEMVVLPYGRLEQVFNTSYTAERIKRLMAEQQYLIRYRRERDLLTLSAAERYRRLMDKDILLAGQISVKHMASYLGIRPESLSRIRAAYAKERK